MANGSRIYVVEENGEAIALVRARNRSEAIRHSVANRFGAEVADQDDLVRLVGDGMAVEDAAVPVLTDAVA